MNRPIHIHLLPVIALLLLVGPDYSAEGEFQPSMQQGQSATGQTDREWLRLAPDGEEFSAMIPALPSVMTQPENYSFEVGGEKVLERRNYAGYVNGFVFVIESYKASRPQKILKPIFQFATARASFERNVMVDGSMTREYKSNNAAFYGRILCLLAKRHVYVLTLAARDEKNDLSEHFLNSFTLNDQSVPRTQEGMERQIPLSAPGSAVAVVSTKEVTRKAAIVWKPEPSYTEQARRDQLTGTVFLQAIFAADGQVAGVKVIAGLPDGLTEKAVEAARNIRFFPAEKDGRLVSLELKLEYNFNLY
jgi:TonB family protein